MSDQTTPKLGERMSQCAACRQFFTTTASFDKHRTWATEGGIPWVDKARPEGYERRMCIDPESVGLVFRENGAWGSPPMTDEQKARMGWTR